MHTLLDAADSRPTAEYNVTVRPNNSLSPAQRFLCFFLIGLVTLGIAMGFTYVGAWPVLPFAGIEVAVLIWAMHAMARHANDYEMLTITEEKILVECVNARKCSRQELSRYWAQVVLEDMDRGTGHRLALRSHGKEVEFGRHMRDHERVALAWQLKQKIKPFI
jgi:uncharacterized membrane protein